MKVLLDGASSFTGFWFARELCAAGHEVLATFQGQPEDYHELPRGARVDQLKSTCAVAWGASFGSERFLGIARSESGWDLFCHHAADATNYRSARFDVVAAVASNTRNAAAVLSALQSRGCNRMVLTGSIFEGGEGAGSDGVLPVSAYGVSKQLTAEAFRFHCRQGGLALGKFVIPNPFGPYEEARFTAYLMRQWLSGDRATVRTPRYVRDNIHVSLLARAYVDFAERLSRTDVSFLKLNPSGYIESMGAFANRMASEMRTRIGRPCELELAAQRELDEPLVRINTDPPDIARFGWSEERAWDAIARYYESLPG
jgi:UDP-glucose 4-epimerase